MTRAITYPATLPGVASISYKRTARAAVSEARGLARSRALDRVSVAEVAWEIPFSMAETFSMWHAVALLNGQRKAALPLPGAGAIVVRVVRFTTPLKREMLEHGYRFSATLQITDFARVL